MFVCIEKGAIKEIWNGFFGFPSWVPGLAGFGVDAFPLYAKGGRSFGENLHGYLLVADPVPKFSTLTCAGREPTTYGLPKLKHRSWGKKLLIVSIVSELEKGVQLRGQLFNY